jgi:GAF domain-containing protein
MRRRTIFLYTTAGVLFGMLFPLTSTLWLLIEGGYALTMQNILLVQTLHPLEWMIDTAPIFLGFFAWIAGVRQANVLDLNKELITQISDKERLADELGSLKNKLEHHAEKQLVELKSAAQVAREAAAIHDLDRLLENTANLISNRFGFYHAGIFLLDERREYAVLCAASSEGGKKMLARQHKLPVGKVGIVGYAAGTGEPRIALDVGSDATFFNNPDLPQTRSEAAIPLKSRNVVIGILDVQSAQPNAFSDDDVAILQTLADQLTLAIDNARLFSETQNNIQELAAVNRRLVAQAWQPRATPFSPAYIYDPIKGIKQIALKDLPEIKADNTSLIAPILFRGQSLGTLALKRGEGEPAWTQVEIEFFNGMVSQLGMALENARMFEDTQQQAEREKLVGDISAKLWASSDIETIVRTAVEEIGVSLNLTQAILELEVPDYQR